MVHLNRLLLRIILGLLLLCLSFFLSCSAQQQQRLTMQDINRSSGGYRSGGKEEGVHSGWKQYKFSLYWLLAPALSLSLFLSISHYFFRTYHHSFVCCCIVLAFFPILSLVPCVRLYMYVAVCVCVIITWLYVYNVKDLIRDLSFCDPYACILL